jgi:hypothetical protein
MKVVRHLKMYVPGSPSLWFYDGFAAALHRREGWGLRALYRDSGLFIETQHSVYGLRAPLRGGAHGSL